MVRGKTVPFAGHGGNVDLWLASARRRHSRPAWRLAGDNRVLVRRNEEGSPQSRGSFGSGLTARRSRKGTVPRCRASWTAQKAGHGGRAGLARGRITRQTERVPCASTTTRTGEGSTARHGCAHGSCQLQKSEGGARSEEATSSYPTNTGGLGAVAADPARGGRGCRKANAAERGSQTP